jgi:hypothetical protein
MYSGLSHWPRLRHGCCGNWADRRNPPLEDRSASANESHEVACLCRFTGFATEPAERAVQVNEIAQAPRTWPSSRLSADHRDTASAKRLAHPGWVPSQVFPAIPDNLHLPVVLKGATEVLIQFVLATGDQDDPPAWGPALGAWGRHNRGREQAQSQLGFDLDQAPERARIGPNAASLCCPTCRKVSQDAGKVCGASLNPQDPPPLTVASSSTSSQRQCSFSAVARRRERRESWPRRRSKALRD